MGSYLPAVPESPQQGGTATLAAPETRTMTPWVILPTYNEAENLERIVGAVLERLPAFGRVLVVDDNSPDGTGEIADRLASAEDSVDVLHRPRKEGLGPAYLAGFRVALDGGADRIIEMDADFSHDPADLPRLIEATEERRPRDRLPLRARRRGHRLGPDEAVHQPRRERLRPASRWVCRFAT